MEIFILEGGQFTEARVIGSGQNHSVTVPGLVIELEHIFAGLDSQ